MSARDWPRCPILTGRAWAIGLDVSADLLLAPEHHASAEPQRHLMTAIDPQLPSRIEPGDILVGGGGFADGTTDDAAVRALLASGIAAVIAYSFDPAFARFALARGLPAVEVNESLAIHTGAQLRVDLEGSRVVNMSSGDRYPIRNVSDDMLARFRVSDA